MVVRLTACYLGVTDVSHYAGHPVLGLVGPVRKEGSVNSVAPSVSSACHTRKQGWDSSPSSTCLWKGCLHRNQVFKLSVESVEISSMQAAEPT